MAVGDAVMPSPPLAAWILVAALAFVRLLQAAPDALAYLSLASAWVVCASSAAMVVGRHVCGEVSLAALAALRVAALKVSICSIILLFTLLVAVLLCVCCLVAIERFKFNISFEIKKSFGAIMCELPRELFPTIAVYGWLASVTFILLMVAGYLVIMWLSPVEGSQAERIGSVMVDVGLFGARAMLCFIVIPAYAVRIWRTRRTVKQDAPWQCC